jgi:hypothetical protein
MKITSDDLSYDFSTIESVFIDDLEIPSTDFILQDAEKIEFEIPPDEPPAEYPITVSGTQFSGTAFVAPLTVLLIKASGVYKLTPGKTCDTLYLDSSVDGSTYDTADSRPDFKVRIYWWLRINFPVSYYISVQ